MADVSKLRLTLLRMMRDLAARVSEDVLKENFEGARPAASRLFAMVQLDTILEREGAAHPDWPDEKLVAHVEEVVVKEMRQRTPADPVVGESVWARLRRPPV